jgi:hypothetical protein
MKFFTFQTWDELQAKATVALLIGVWFRTLAAWAEFIWKVYRTRKRDKVKAV